MVALELPPRDRAILVHFFNKSVPLFRLNLRWKHCVFRTPQEEILRANFHPRSTYCRVLLGPYTKVCGNSSSFVVVHSGIDNLRPTVNFLVLLVSKVVDDILRVVDRLNTECTNHLIAHVTCIQKSSNSFQCLLRRSVKIHFITMSSKHSDTILNHKSVLCLFVYVLTPSRVRNTRNAVVACFKVFELSVLDRVHWEIVFFLEQSNSVHFHGGFVSTLRNNR